LAVPDSSPWRVIGMLPSGSSVSIKALRDILVFATATVH